MKNVEIFRGESIDAENLKKMSIILLEMKKFLKEQKARNVTPFIFKEGSFISWEEGPSIEYFWTKFRKEVVIE